VAPEGFKGGLKMFMETGKLGEPTEIRKKLKLPKPPESGVEDFKKLIEEIKSRKNPDHGSQTQSMPREVGEENIGELNEK
jgi:hypothetical protein